MPVTSKPGRPTKASELNTICHLKIVVSDKEVACPINDQEPIFWMYIIRNSAGKFYVGHTDDLEQRLEFHNTGQSHYTARKGPWELVYSEHFRTRAEAARRESEIKRWKSAVKIRELIASSEL